jgi:hypothetical protein
MATVADQWPRPHRITVDEYYRMAEVGLLRADERVELIEGEVNKQLHCRREPIAESYQRTETFQISQRISVMAFPDIALEVAALFD